MEAAAVTGVVVVVVEVAAAAGSQAGENSVVSSGAITEVLREVAVPVIAVLVTVGVVGFSSSP